MPLIFPYPVSSGTTFQTGSSPVYIYNGSHWKIDSSNKSTSGTSGSNGSSGTSGLQGPAGQTLTVKGVYSSYSGLTGLTPTNLDTYIVQDTSHLWIYNPSSPSANGAGWVDMGQIQGPKGENGTSGSSGSNGSSGTSGSSGGTGSSGSSGSNGSSGSSGSNGSSGTSGSSGSNGSSGSSGSNGSSGTSGTSGSSGSSGSNGSSGTSGSSGSNGSSGTSGSSGSNGSSGTSGSNGSSGTAGTSGSSGSNGSSGTSGSSGSAGTSGTSGSSGSSGTSGSSGSSGTAGTSGSSGTSGLVTLTGSTTGGVITYNGSGTNATVQSGLTFTNNTLSITGSIVPGATNSYDLGSVTNQWRHLYISTGSLYINNIPIISLNSNNTIQLGTQVFNTTGSTNTPNIVTGSLIVSGSQSVTGSVSVTNTVSAPTGSFSNVIVNGQPTIYGLVSPTIVTDTNPVVNTTFNNGSSASPALTILTLAIPSAGTWRLDAELRVYVPAAGYMAAAFYDNGTLIPNSEYFVAGGAAISAGAASGQYGGFMSYVVTTTSARTITLGAWSTTNSSFIASADGRTWARATLLTPSIAIQATATGTLNTDFIQVGRITSSQTVSNAATPQDIIFNTNIVTNSGITYNTSTGVFTLTAGKTYEFESQITYNGMAANNNYILFTWVDATTNGALDSSGTSVGTVIPTTWGGQAGTPNTNYGGISKVIYTPSTNQTVKVRIIAGVGSGSISAGQGTYAKITQIANQFALTAISGLTTTGDVSVGGNLTVTGTGGNVLTKASGLVNAGTFVSLDNIKASITTSGNRGLSLAAVSTTFTADISGYYGYTAGGNGASTYNASITTSATTSIFNWGFNTQGDGSTYTVFDKTNNRVYRITIMINNSFNSNFISIERLH